MPNDANPIVPDSAPRWLRAVILGDKHLSAAYVGVGFTFAPLLVILDPWRPLVVGAWIVIGTAGLWLGILGILMAIGLGMVLRAGDQMPDAYWDSVLTQPTVERGAGGALRSPRS